MVALCMMYIYICLGVCGWLCTLYHSLLWLHEWPSLIMRALDLVVWVYAQGDCHRCIFMLYCVHNHSDVIVLIHVTKWHWFPCICDTHQHGSCFEGLRLIIVRACRYKRKTLPMRHSAPNTKLCRIFTVKMGHTPLPYSHMESLVRIAFCVLWHI